MPRRARLAVPGIPWHIIQRGNNRSPCFFSDADYDYYLFTLQKQSALHKCKIHAYVLMTNHVHLLVTPENVDSASLMMKHLGQRHTQYINRTYNRTGTLWDGRFKSCLAQDGGYALYCYRYIELNPVRAMMVYRPQDYRWTSYRANAQGEYSSIITPHTSYLGLGEERDERLKSYQKFVLSASGDESNGELRRATNGNYVFGSAKFKAEISSELSHRVEPGKPGRPTKS